MTEFDLYLLTRLDSLQCLFAGITVVSVLGFIVSLITMGMWYDSLGKHTGLIEIWKKIRKYTFISVAVFVFGVLGSITIPSTKEMIAILFVPKIVNNEQVQGIGEDGLKLIRAKLDQWTNDVLEETTEKVVDKVTK